MSVTGNSSGSFSGFTMIEVLLSVAILGIALVFIISGYDSALSLYEKARSVGEGSMILQEKLVESQLAVRSGSDATGSESGKEGKWKWTTEVIELQPGALYKISVEAKEAGRKSKVSAVTYAGKK